MALSPPKDSKKAIGTPIFKMAISLVFGSEHPKGIDRHTLLEKSPENVLRIPQAADERCLNLSTAVGIALYEALA